MSNVFITGVLGQIGSHLADICVDKGHTVYGLMRRASVPHMENIVQLLDNPSFKLVEGDITDSHCMLSLVRDIKPEFIFNEAAMSHVKSSFTQPKVSIDVDLIGVLNILEAVKEYSKDSVVLQMSTSEMFGNNYKLDSLGRKTQDETVEFKPASPYGVAKAAAHELMRVYNESYSLNTVCAITFNSEGPRRGRLFVTKKITYYVANLYFKYKDSFLNNNFPEVDDNEKLRLGNISAKRDFGYAHDTARALYMIANNKPLENFCIATGISHSIEDFLNIAFHIIHPQLDWRNYVIIDQNLYRPNEVNELRGNSSKIRQKLNWKPSITFQQLVENMVQYDINLAEKHGILYA